MLPNHSPEIRIRTLRGVGVGIRDTIALNKPTRRCLCGRKRISRLSYLRGFRGLRSGQSYRPTSERCRAYEYFDLVRTRLVIRQHCGLTVATPALPFPRRSPYLLPAVQGSLATFPECMDSLLYSANPQRVDPRIFEGFDQTK